MARLPLTQTAGQKAGTRQYIIVRGSSSTRESQASIQLFLELTRLGLGRTTTFRFHNDDMTRKDTLILQIS
jgi:hypothetical protein